MRIVIVGGRAIASCLIELLQQRRDVIVVINDDVDFCEHLSNQYDVDVVCGDGTMLHVLEEAQIEEFDTCIALASDDADNLAICQLCLHYFGIENHTCLVNNPANVTAFKRLGIDNAIGGMDLLAHAVEDAVCETSKNYLCRR